MPAEIDLDLENITLARCKNKLVSPLRSRKSHSPRYFFESLSKVSRNDRSSVSTFYASLDDARSLSIFCRDMLQLNSSRSPLRFLSSEVTLRKLPTIIIRTKRVRAWVLMLNFLLVPCLCSCAPVFLTLHENGER